MDVQYQNNLLNNDSRNQLGAIGQTSKEDLSKQLKSTEKELKKAKKLEKRLNKKVNKNSKEQQDIVREIEKQMGKVEEVKAKLDNIR
jgi:phage-related tail protein